MPFVWLLLFPQDSAFTAPRGCVDRSFSFLLTITTSVRKQRQAIYKTLEGEKLKERAGERQRIDSYSLVSSSATNAHCNGTQVLRTRLASVGPASHPRTHLKVHYPPYKTLLASTPMRIDAYHCTSTTYTHRGQTSTISTFPSMTKALPQPLRMYTGYEKCGRKQEKEGERLWSKEAGTRTDSPSHPTLMLPTAAVVTLELPPFHVTPLLPKSTVTAPSNNAEASRKFTWGVSSVPEHGYDVVEDSRHRPCIDLDTSTTPSSYPCFRTQKSAPEPTRITLLGVFRASESISGVSGIP
uniref:Uncharacterized protein n=1 Tax=Moniliophthora roreri TaxID=221103 RepID=A0A0W0G9D1_MONRR